MSRRFGGRSSSDGFSPRCRYGPNGPRLSRMSSPVSGQGPTSTGAEKSAAPAAEAGSSWAAPGCRAAAKRQPPPLCCLS